MSITKELAKIITTYQFDTLPSEAITIAKQCILDWFGVTIAAIDEPLVQILKEDLGDNSGKASLICGGSSNPLNAALVNGANGHALDYDDSNPQMIGHPTVPIFGALLALAEDMEASGKEIITALIAGVETSCRIAQIIDVQHYAIGFHPSSTLGTFGAAAACGHLLKLDAQQMEQALSIASCQAAGIKAVFGSHSKPFQVGKANMNGLLAARLASKGFTGGENALEHKQGFIQTHTTKVNEADWQANGSYMSTTLFKYYAACYLTHSEIEALKEARAEGLSPEEVASITLEVPELFLNICNIQEPKTPLETKFSMRHIAGMALYDMNTAAISAYSQACVEDARLAAMRDKVTIIGNQPAGMAATVTITKTDGTLIKKTKDVAQTEADLSLQQHKLEEKFKALAMEKITVEQADGLIEKIRALEQLKSCASILDMVVSLPLPQ